VGDGSAHLDVVDVGHLCRVGELESRGRHLEDHDPGSPGSVVRLEFSQPEHVAIEGECGVEVGGLEHEPQLRDRIGHRVVGHFRLFCIR
jgi:hypothetical protein